MREDYESIRLYLLKFAILHTRDKQLAEDLVQDTLLVAFDEKKAQQRQGELQPWLFGVLRNKILDVYRERKRRPSVSFEIDLDDVSDAFDEREHWLREQRPNQWQTPDGHFENQQFWRVFEACVSKLPPHSGRVYSMRELLEMEVDDICEQLGCSSNQLYVALHRARFRLRECLDMNWFTSAQEQQS